MYAGPKTAPPVKLVALRALRGILQPSTLLCGTLSQVENSRAQEPPARRPAMKPTSAMRQVAPHRTLVSAVLITSVLIDLPHSVTLSALALAENRAPAPARPKARSSCPSAGGPAPVRGQALQLGRKPTDLPSRHPRRVTSTRIHTTPAVSGAVQTTVCAVSGVMVPPSTLRRAVRVPGRAGARDATGWRPAA